MLTSHVFVDSLRNSLILSFYHVLLPSAIVVCIDLAMANACHSRRRAQIIRTHWKGSKGLLHPVGLELTKD